MTEPVGLPAVRLRSLLYVPAWNAGAIDAARGLSCDAVIICLEDATPADRKIEARRTVLAALEHKQSFNAQIIVRVNGLDTEWGRGDLAALRDANPDAILAPSVTSADEVRAFDSLTAVPLWIMIETAESVLRLDMLAAASRETRLQAFVLGTNDLARALRAKPGLRREPFWQVFTSAIAAARAHGLAVYDGIFMDVDDSAGLQIQCEQAAQFGFDGKTLFSPRQIDICNKAFA